MAINWDITVTPINLATKEVTVEAIRTDVDGSTMSYSVPRVKMDTVTVANNLPILNEIWSKHQASLTATETIKNFVSGLEALGKTNLEARE